MRFGESLQSFLRSAVPRVRRDLLLLPSGELFQIFAAGTEAELAVKPERSGVDRFVIILADLVRIDRNRVRARERAQAAQRLRINPRGLALTIGIEGIEANFDPLAQPDGFDVIDGNAILNGESRNICAKRQTTRRGQIPEMHDNAPTERSADDGTRVAERSAIEFAVANRHHFTNGVHHELAFAWREFRQARSR